jgi:hypothetical protein
MHHSLDMLSVNAECRYAERHCANCGNVECCCTECRHAECHSADSHGAWAATEMFFLFVFLKKKMKRKDKHWANVCQT